jgi:PKD repeat protein
MKGSALLLGLLVILATALSGVSALTSITDVQVWSDFETSGIDLIDVTGHQNGSVIGTTIILNDTDKPANLPFSYLGAFDGSNYLEWASNANQDVLAGESKSWSLWLKDPAANTGASGDFDGGVSQGLFANLGGNPYFYFICGANPVVFSASTPSAGWHLYTGQYNATAAEIELFVDGVSQGTASTAGCSFPVTNAVARKIGYADENLGGAAIMAASQWIMANDSFTQPQIACLYNSGAGRNYTDFQSACLTPAPSSPLSNPSYKFDFENNSGESTGAIFVNLTEGDGTISAGYAALGNGKLFGERYANLSGSPQIIDLSNGFSVSAWVKYQGVDPAAGVLCLACAGQDVSANIATPDYFNFIQAGSQIVFDTYSNGNYGAGTISPFQNFAGQNDTYRHIVMTYNGSDNSVLAYVDGVLQSTGYDVPFNGTAGNLTYSYLVLGSFETSTQLDHVKIYNYTLNQTDVTSLFSEITPNAVFTANFTYVQANNATPSNVIFNQTSYGGYGTNTTYVWDFQNDGIIDSIDPNTNYTFVGNGSYDVNLTIWDGLDTSTSIQTIFVDVAPAVPPVITNPQIRSANPTKVNETNFASNVITGLLFSGYQGSVISVDAPTLLVATYSQISDTSNETIVVRGSNSSDFSHRFPIINHRAEVNQVLLPGENYIIYQRWIPGGNATQATAATCTDLGNINVVGSSDVNPFLLRTDYNCSLNVRFGPITYEYQLLNETPGELKDSYLTYDVTLYQPHEIASQFTNLGGDIQANWSVSVTGLLSTVQQQENVTSLEVNFSITDVFNVTSNVSTASAYLERAPVVNFTAAPLNGSAPLTVNFTDTSTNNKTSWAWDFENDGIVDSTTQNPQYTYNSTGNYSINLTVAGPGGTRSTIKTNYVEVTSPSYIRVTSGACTNALTYPNELDGPSVAQLSASFLVNATPLGSLVSTRLVQGNIAGNCSFTNVSMNVRNYTCDYPIHYYTPSANYSVEMTYTNTLFTNATNVTTCAVGELLAYQQVQVSTIQFPGAAPGISNVQGSSPVTIQNTGNKRLYIKRIFYAAKQYTDLHRRFYCSW